jgi:ELWxxDGT repeat protein
MKTITTSLLILLVYAFAQAQPVFLKELSLQSQNFVSSNGKLYYTSGDSLWKSDGTPAGTIYVKKINESDISLTGMTIGTSFFFTAKESSGKTSLWKSDGTSVNTVKLVAYNQITPLLVHGGALYLAINNGSSGIELWKTTGGAPSIVKDINPGSGNGFVGNLIVSGGQLFFQANSGSGGINIWKSNGTTAGTLLAANVAFDDYGLLTDVNGTIYFGRNTIATYDSFGSTNSKAELWKTNGTTAGTVLVKRFAKNEEEGNLEFYESISDFYAANGKLYFRYYANYDNSLPYHYLYESNGTGAGTREISNITIDGPTNFVTEAKGKIVYQGNSQSFAGAVQAYDPVSATKFFLKSDPFSSEDVHEYAVAGNYFFFVDAIDAYMGGTSGENSQQLWQTDLAPGNAKAVKSLFKGTDFAGTNNLTPANDKIFFTTYADYFQANPAAKKKRLWYYDPVKPVVPVAYFTVVNADTDEEIQVLEMGDQINKPANVNISIRYHEVTKPASVVFKLADTTRRIENSGPYLLAGDNNGNYSPWLEAKTGVHKVTAIPYTQTGGKGTAGTATTVEFYIKALSKAPIANAGPDREIQLPKDTIIIYGKETDDGTINSRQWQRISGPSFNYGYIDNKLMVQNMVAGEYIFRYLVYDNEGQQGYDDVKITVKPATQSGPAVVAYYLINADTDQRIRLLSEGDTLDLAHLPSNLNIQVVTNPSVVGSVRVQYFSRNFVESVAPYSLFGDNNGNYNSGNLQLGNNIVLATPYTQKSGGGTAGTSLRTGFFIKRSAPTLMTASREANMEVNAYPNPSDGLFTFSVVNQLEGKVIGEIYTVEGNPVTRVVERNAQVGELIEFQWNAAGMNPGVYYVKFLSGDTVKTKRLVVKE